MGNGLVDIGISRVSSACYRMEVEIACRFATTCRQMCADTSQATPVPFKLAMIPCSNHLCHSQCTVDMSKCLSAITWVLWGKKKITTVIFLAEVYTQYCPFCSFLPLYLTQHALEGCTFLIIWITWWCASILRFA